MTKTIEDSDLEILTITIDEFLRDIAYQSIIETSVVTDKLLDIRNIITSKVVES